MTWSRIQDPDLEDPAGGDVSMGSVAAGPTGFVAVGRGPEGAIAWVSDDGVAWERASGSGFGRGVVEQVVALDRGFVAVGRGEHGAAASWTSPDGRTWSEPVTLPGLDEGLISQIAVGPGGVLAIGYALADTTRYRLWTSVDGRSWNGIGDAPAISADPTATVALAASADEYVIVGTPDATGSMGSVAWRSPDGVRWKMATTGLGANLQAFDVAIGPGGLVASLVDPASSSWSLGHSSDGSSWTTQSVAGPDVRVALVPGGFLATGGSDRRRELLLSSDGVAWTPIETSTMLERSRILDVAVRGATTVAVGERETTAGVTDAAVWVSSADASVEPSASPRTCSDVPPDIGSLIRLEPAGRLSCFGDLPISVRAYVVPFGGLCAGTGITPAWLGDCPGVFLQGGPGISSGLPAHLPPSAPMLPTHRWAQVTGHFDDPAALACRQTPEPGAIAEPVEASVLACRRQFVVSGVQEATGP